MLSYFIDERTKVRMTMLRLLSDFLEQASNGAGQISNERSLQLEIGMMFRNNYCDVRFEKVCRALPNRPEHTKRQKRDLDLLVSRGNETLAMELKAPFSGRVPETMYDFYSDIAFVEAIVEQGIADRGVCLIVTNDNAYWSGREKGGIYEPLRNSGAAISGLIRKPTGRKDEAIVVSGNYVPVWRDIGNREMLPDGRYALLNIL